MPRLTWLSLNQIRTDISQRWTAVLVVSVFVQIGTTFLFPQQKWSMPIGLAFMMFCCGVIVLQSTPTRGPDRWRWPLIALGFVFWSLTFVAIGYQDNYLSGKDSYSSLLGSLKAICFIIVLMPSGSIENSIAFRITNLLQGIIFTIAMMTMTWGSVFNIKFDVNLHYVFLNYLFIVVFAVIGYINQTTYLTRKFLLNIVILQISYAIISTLSNQISVYGFEPNSPIWVMGDITFLIFGIRASKLIKLRDVEFGSETDYAETSYRRHLPPVLLTVLVLIMAFEIATKNAVLGSILGILALLTHVVRTTLLLDRYLAARDKLIAAEKQHSRLLIDMIHEVRAPLGSMVLNASMLQRSAELPDRQARWVEQIGAGGSRVTTMLNDVLEIERIDAGLIGPDLADYGIGAILDAAVAVVSPQAASAEIAIRVHGAVGKVAWADRALIERVFVNLLTNAVRFTAQGGNIAITVSEDRDGMIAIRVKDDGAGIPPDILATAFDRFSQTGVPLRGHPGSGLGLSICRGLMTLMKGEIALESRLGEGAMAIVRVPRADPAKRTAHDG